MVMVGWPVVAGLAVCRPSYRMIEAGGRPGAGVVASRALPGEVVGGFFIRMAGLAVGRPGSLVIELSRLPGGSRMAG